MIHYADDTTLTTTINTSQTSNNSDDLNNKLQHIHTWLKDNKLLLNINKTKFMIFHTPQKRITIPNLLIDNTPIQNVADFNFLGITINQHLSWKPHQQKISSKMSKFTGVLNKLKHQLPNYILLKIYHSLILPHFNYGVLVWCHNPNSIFKLQKRIVRIITNSRYNSHTDPLFKRLNLLKISDIRQYFELKFFHKLTNSQTPEYFQQNFISSNQDIHRIQTRHSQELSVPTHHHHFFQTTLRYTLVKTVNHTPQHLIELLQTHSLPSFSSRIKQYLIQQYSDHCQIPNCPICANGLL